MRMQSGTAYGQVQAPMSFAMSYTATPEENIRSNPMMEKIMRAMLRSKLA